MQKDRKRDTKGYIQRHRDRTELETVLDREKQTWAERNRETLSHIDRDKGEGRKTNEETEKS